MTRLAHLLFLMLLGIAEAAHAETNRDAKAWSASLGADHSSDSDTIAFDQEVLQSEYRFSEALSLEARMDNVNMSADKASGLTTIHGKEEVSMQGGLLGIKQKYNDALTLELSGGVQQSSEDTGTIPYAMKADWQPMDALQAVLTVTKEMYALSPKAISLDIEKLEGTLQLVWQATKRLTIEGRTGYADFSDDNERRGFLLSPRYRVLQDASDHMDAGLRFRWYGFTNHLNDGYYSPERYQSYNVPLSYYRQFGEHHVLLSVAPGIYKDQSVNGFRFAGDALAEAVFKVNEAWDFNMHAAFIRSGGITNSEYTQRLVGIAAIHYF